MHRTAPAARFERTALGLLLVCATLGQTATAAPTRYVVGKSATPSTVRFVSRAPVEDFEGKTSEVSGWIEVDPDDLRAGARWHIEVDLASLDTGIGLRNRHMRENHLHTKDHPVAVFEGSGLPDDPPATLDVDGALELVLTGTLALHGVERERAIPTEIQFRADGTLRVRAEFSIALSDHAIPRPKFLVMKLADEQEIEVDLVAHPQTEGEVQR